MMNKTGDYLAVVAFFIERMIFKTEGTQRMRRAAPCLVMMAVFFVLVGTSQMLPLVWDEGELISRASAVKAWGERAVVSPMGDEEHMSPFSQEGITESWKSTTTIEGHPGGYLVVIAFGRTLADVANAFTPDFLPKLSPKTAWRFGPILMMSLALGVLFSAVRKHFDTAAALFSVVAVLLTPRVFAHAHFATCDGVLMAAWLLAVATFPMPRDDDQSMQTAPLLSRLRFQKSVLPAIIWGLCLGLTLSAKFTGWAVFGVWSLVFGVWCWRKARIFFAQTLTKKTPHSPIPHFFALCIALLVFYALNPPLWHRPISGLADFLHLNTHRGQYNVSILFWGQMYHLEKPLPWYNTLVWVAITFPTLLFVMLPFGVHRMFVNDRDIQVAQANRVRFSWLIVLNAMVLLVVRAIPGTPPHDGVRLFVVAFPFLAVIAGIGMSVVWRLRWGNIFSRVEKAKAAQSALIGRLVVATVLVVCGGNLVSYAPQWLSFYNAVIGGVNGAARNGFEPTYYWDAFDAEVIAVLNKNTAEHEKIRLTTARSSKTFDLVRAWDGLQPKFRPNKPGEYRWYVFQMRPSALLPVDRVLLRDFEPAYVKSVSQPSLFFLQTRETPILYVFENDDYLKALEIVP